MFNYKTKINVNIVGQTRYSISIEIDFVFYQMKFWIRKSLCGQKELWELGEQIIEIPMFILLKQRDIS